MALKQKIAIVTGASSGIGAAIGRSLVGAGWGVVLVGRDQERLDEIKSSSSSRGEAVWTFVCDLANADQRAALVDFATGSFEAISAIIHSAGSYEWARLQDSTDEDLARILTLNTIAPLSLSRAILSRMPPNESDIVFLNSSVVQGAGAGLAAYAASKHALKGAADCLRAEINELGIRVLSVYPGRTASPMQERVFEREGRNYVPQELLQPEDIAAVVTHSISLPRSAEITDLHIRPHAKP